MAAKVYTFTVSYEGLESRIWRKVEVSSNYRLDQLGYMVLAAFDTLAYHLFEFHYGDQIFEIPEARRTEEQIDMAGVNLGQLGLQLGDRVRMDYDFGTTQTFWLEVVGIEDMKQGRGRRYPYVLDGAGRGIIDDLSCDELREMVDQIDRNGHTDAPIYYQDRIVPWDYRWFDLDCINGLLKGEIEEIEEGYAPFWQ